MATGTSVIKALWSAAEFDTESFEQFKQAII